MSTLKVIASPSTEQHYQRDLTRFLLQDDTLYSVDEHCTLILTSSSSHVQLINSLRHLFQHVEHLVIYFGPSHGAQWPHLENHVLCTLLEQWPHLSSLSLLGAIEPLDNSAAFRLATAINSLSSLRRLDVLLTSLCPLPLSRLTPALSRLEHLSLFAYPGDIALALTRLSSSIRQLNLHYIFPLKIYFILDELAPSLIVCPHLVSSLTHLRLSRVANAKILPFITGHFTCLQVLDIEFDLTLKIHFNTRLLLNLNWLRQLAKLRFVNIHLDMEELTKESPLLQSIATIKSVHLIHLKCHGKFNEKLIQQQLSRAFPNADAIFVDFY